PTLDGQDAAAAPTTRALGFGDLVLGSRGLGLRSLSTFLAGNFQTNSTTKLPIADAISGQAYALTRSGWAETRNFATATWAKPLRIRAGRQYASAVWPTHFDGLTIGWDTAVVQAAGFVGTSVADFDPAQASASYVTSESTAGLSAVIALRNTKRKTPMTISFDGLTAFGHNHVTAALAYQPRRDIFASVSARSFDGALAQERFSIRAALGDVSQIALDLDHRHASDWQWNPSWTKQEDGAPRRYLEFGAQTPQLHGVVRAGTVLLDNVDVYGRAAFALDRSPVVDRNTLRPSWVEFGGGAELRLRRAIAITASSLFRDFRRRITPPIVDTPVAADQPSGQPLVQDAHYGEQSILEGGAGFKLTLGAKRFSAAAEIYARRTRFAETYVDAQQSQDADAIDIIPLATTIGGGRIKVDAWVTKHFRVFAVYELTSRFLRAPELNGFNSLRVAVEGAF
ncbi:MAG TPA: hypothetical protein PLF40_20445, partial [Kofleriaceae bacterium]|nr:hypothetical protein [Kofleriaceae bacterium]